MNRLQTKTSLLLFLIIAPLILGGAYMHYLGGKSQTIQIHLTQSLNLRSLLLEIQMSSQRPTDQQKTLLQSYRRTLSPQIRSRHLSELIGALSSNNPYLVKARWDEFMQMEQKFFRHQMMAQAENQKLIYWTALASLLLPLTIALFMWSFIKSSIFSPLSNLSRRMMDFLTDTYSFRFSIPDSSEVGDLQRTFNSLAQKVINHMDELKSLDQAKSDFLSMASHELRTPMTSIKGSLGLLKSGITGQLDRSGLQLIKIAEEETDRLIRLINDLLDLAKIEAGAVSLDKKWTPLSDFLHKNLGSLQGLAQTAQVRLKLITPDEPILALIDQDQMHQVLTNLISNAIKFSPPEGVVHIHLLASKEAGLRIEVVDQGPGLERSQLDRIFDKFCQATSAQTPLVKGTGLGLTIAKALVEQHEGQIGVKSRPGRGATFYVQLKHWKFGQSVADLHHPLASTPTPIQTRPMGADEDERFAA